MDENRKANESIPEKSLIIFGRDVSKVPCYRSTMLNGILGGMGCGLAFFLFTSRVQAASNVAVASFTVIALGYWIQCRYTYSKTRYEMLRLQEALANSNVYEGTEMERKLEGIEKVDI